MTAQIGERLILDGEVTEMASVPPLPEAHPRIVEIEDWIGELKEPQDQILHSTACWREYQGTWAIEDGRFYLVALRGRWRLEGDAPLPADWFSGELRIPQGEVLQYVHMGFRSVYEEDLLIEIERGAVTGSRVVDNRGKVHDEWDLLQGNMPEGEGPGARER